MDRPYLDVVEQAGKRRRRSEWGEEDVAGQDGPEGSDPAVDADADAQGGAVARNQTGEQGEEGEGVRRPCTSDADGDSHYLCGRQAVAGGGCSVGRGGGGVARSTSASTLAQILPRGRELTSEGTDAVVWRLIPCRGGGMAAHQAKARDERCALDGANPRWRVKMLLCFGENRSWADGILMLRKDVHRAVLVNHGDLVVDARCLIVDEQIRCGERFQFPGHEVLVEEMMILKQDGPDPPPMSRPPANWWLYLSPGRVEEGE